MLVLMITIWFASLIECDELWSNFTIASTKIYLKDKLLNLDYPPKKWLILNIFVVVLETREQQDLC
jgi:hypothetical protein